MMKLIQMGNDQIEVEQWWIDHRQWQDDGEMIPDDKRDKEKEKGDQRCFIGCRKDKAL